MGKIKTLKHKVVHGGGLFTLLRSTITAQISAWTDFAVSTLSYAFVFTIFDEFYQLNMSTAAGAIAGGIVNCTINYRFTFHAKGQSKKAVALKFFLVWIGSFLFNMYGTTGCAFLFSKWDWLIEIGFKPTGVYAAARLFVSLIVSLAWNFVLQRWFVYRPNKFDPYAIRFVDYFLPRKKQKK